MPDLIFAEGPVRIGELAARTGISARMLRYYEEQGLLTPDRTSSGYRSYPDGAVSQAGQIRGLLDAGLTTEIIRTILPCLNDPEDVRRWLHAIRESIADLVAVAREGARRPKKRVLSRGEMKRQARASEESLIALVEMAQSSLLA